MKFHPERSKGFPRDIVDLDFFCKGILGLDVVGDTKEFLKSPDVQHALDTEDYMNLFRLWNSRMYAQGKNKNASLIILFFQILQFSGIDFAAKLTLDDIEEIMQMTNNYGIARLFDDD